MLTVTQMLRKKGVVGKFVEFFGDGPGHLTIEDRRPSPTWRPNTARPAASSRSTPETLAYLAAPAATPTASPWWKPTPGPKGCGASRAPEPEFTDTLELDLATVVPSLAGPKRPQDRVLLTDAAPSFAEALAGDFGKADASAARSPVGAAPRTTWATATW